MSWIEDPDDPCKKRKKCVINSVLLAPVWSVEVIGVGVFTRALREIGDAGVWRCEV
jgi:hypothetical protein